MKKEIESKYDRFRPFYCPVLLMILMLCTGFTHPGFLKGSNLLIVMRQSSYLAILALAMAVTVIIGGIDFSVSAIAAVSSSVCGLLMNLGVPVPAAVLMALLTAVLCGAFNGVMLACTTIPPYELTVGTMTLFFCGASYLKAQYPLGILPAQFSYLGKGYLGIFPVAVVLLLLIYVLTYIFLNHTYYGRYLYALGDNPSGLQFIGVNIRNYTILAYVLAAFLAGMAGVLQMSRNNYVNMGNDFSYVVDAIIAITLSGMRLQKSKSGVGGIFTASMLVCFLYKCLNLLGVDVLIQDMIRCALFLVTILVDHYFAEKPLHLVYREIR